MSLLGWSWRFVAPAMTACVVVACGGAPPPGHDAPTGGAPRAQAPRDPSSDPGAIFFATSVPIGDGETSRIYVVLDETRGADAAATGEPSALGDDGVMAASACAVDPARLPAAMRSLAAARFAAIGSRCAGAIGDIVELTLRDRQDGAPEAPFARVLAAPLTSECDGDPIAFQIEGAPRPTLFALDGEADPVTLFDEPARAAMLAVVRALPAYAVLQATYAEATEDDAADTWEDQFGQEPTYEVLRDGAGRTLVRVRVGSSEASVVAVLERVGDDYAVRVSGDASWGLLLDLDDDRSIDAIDRLGLSTNGEHVRRFERTPFVLGC